MKNIEVVLYKMTIFSGKEGMAKEWLAFLDANKEAASKLLVKENAYYSAYFSSVENNIMYVYMTFASDDVVDSNQATWDSENELNLKHLEYMHACVDREKSIIILSATQQNNF